MRRADEEFIIFFSASEMFGRISKPQPTSRGTSTLLSRIHTQKRVEVLLQVYDLSTLLTQDQGSLLYTYPRCPFRYGECEWTQDPARQRYRPRAHACDDMRSGYPAGSWIARLSLHRGIADILKTLNKYKGNRKAEAKRARALNGTG